MKPFISDEQWFEYFKRGYLRLGRLLSDAQVTALCQRIDDIMLGRAAIDYERLTMQLDPSAAEADYANAGEFSRGFKGATLGYRKIQELQYDPLFLTHIQRPEFRSICAEVYGAHTPVACFRAMFMNKPAGRGTDLGWHQDRWSILDRDPLVTVYTALDPATRENGCLRVIPGSHRRGVINTANVAGHLTREQVREHCRPEDEVFLEMDGGEVYLLHNWTLHASGTNRSGGPRRAFSVCYMDARTVSTRGDRFSVVFGDGALTPGSLAAAPVATT